MRYGRCKRTGPEAVTVSGLVIQSYFYSMLRNSAGVIIVGCSKEHPTAQLENISLSVMLLLFVCYMYLPAGLVLLAVSLLFIPNMWLSLPVIMLLASKPWLAGTFRSVDYLMVCMMPMLLAKMYMAISVDLFGYKNMMISKKKIENVVNEQEKTGNEAVFETDTHEICFENLRFSYVKGEPALQGVNFCAEDQKLTAIVGDSGSGKSTILNLVAKYYEADSGVISIGGKKIQTIAAERVLEQISMVDQDVFLFDDTIRENIRHARPDATDAEIEAAHTIIYLKMMDTMQEPEYYKGEDGLLYCGKCHKPKEA